jgi:hypothetical protein
MKARKLIDGASFAPEVVKAMGEAFDAAWAEIVRNYGSEPKLTEEPRMRLAEAILAVAAEGFTDVGHLKDRALQLMAKSYRTDFG